MIKRCDKILQDYESKLHLVERFAKAKDTIKEIQSLAGGKVPMKGADEKSRLQRIVVLCGELLKEL